MCDWLIGSIWFYVIATVTSTLRAKAKTKLSLLKFIANFADKTDAELIQAFKEIDADGGGALDNKELVQAWQKATRPSRRRGSSTRSTRTRTARSTSTSSSPSSGSAATHQLVSDQFSDAKLEIAMYDDDGNNEMDKDELVVAWKKATDKKIYRGGGGAIARATNGNSTLDKDEFVPRRAHG